MCQEYYVQNFIQIQIYKQGNKTLMAEQTKEQCFGGFEDFPEQYTTYTRANLNSPPSKNTKNADQKRRNDKLKLKMIDSNNNQQDIFNLLSNRKNCKNVSNSSKIITIGNAIFRSNFESGNLYSITKVTPNTYEVGLTSQTNSERTSAWFYFAAEGLKGQIKFIVKGFTKTSSLYNSGMKVCYRQTSGDSKWRRGCSKISYQQSQSQNQSEKNGYQLHFSYFFKASPNSIEFAFCFPYTYTSLLKFIKLQNIKYQIIGKTYQGREIPVLTVGNPKSQKVVIISARAHPGETVGSYMMEGFLKQLNTNTRYSNYLREAFLFKIVPMINIDGVVNGNYRFSGSGFDLNRKWKKCNEKIHPQVFHLKELIKKMNKDKQVIMYIDLHGHSRQKNVFFYGCCPKGALDKQGKPNTKPKQFPFLMSKLHPAFRYDYCSFAVQKEKQGTGRINTWNQLKIDYVYTLQASFCGSQGGANYLIEDYLKIGAKLCQGICLHFWGMIKTLIPELNKKKVIVRGVNGEQQVNEEEEPVGDQKIQQQLSKNMNQFFENPALAAIDYAQNSSDSEPEAGQIPIDKRKKNISIHKISQNIKTPFDHKNNPQNKKTISNKATTLTLKTKGQQKNKTDQSVKIRADNLQKKQFEQNCEQFKRNSFHKSHLINKNQTYYVRTDILSRNINQKLSLIENSQRFLSSDMRMTEEAEGLIEEVDQKFINNKKKAMSFEGAQYRRVRKIAQQFNNKNHSVNKVSFVEDSDELIKGLSGINNFVAIQRLHPKSRIPNVFPHSSTNYRNRKLSTQLSLRRNKKQEAYNSSLGQNNGLDLQVKCLGKHK